MTRQNDRTADRPQLVFFTLFQHQFNLRMRMCESADAGGEMILRQKRKRADAERLAFRLFKVAHFLQHLMILAGEL